LSAARYTLKIQLKKTKNDLKACLAEAEEAKDFVVQELEAELAEGIAEMFQNVTAKSLANRKQ